MNRYPLIENAAGQIHASNGRALEDITLAAASAGELTIADLQISAVTLRAQAEVARQAGYPQLAENLARAAELTAVPNEAMLRMYDALRPGRVSLEQLHELAELLERTYAAPRCAALVRAAAEAYHLRGLARVRRAPETGG
jgi:propanediol dehydratase small subunit